MQIPMGPGLALQGQFGLVPPFRSKSLSQNIRQSVWTLRHNVVQRLNQVKLSYKEAQFLLSEMIRASSRFKPLVNPAYFMSTVPDEYFKDMTGLSKTQFFDLRNRLEFTNIDFTTMHKGNIDSELFRTLVYARNLISARTLSGLTGIGKRKLMENFWSIVITIVLNISPLPQFLFFTGNNQGIRICHVDKKVFFLLYFKERRAIT